MGVLGAVGGMEAVRALPPAAQIQAVKGIAEAGNAVDRAGNAVRNWARNNPNTSEVAKAAANVGGTAFVAAKGISHVRIPLVKNNNGLDSHKPSAIEGEMFHTRNVAFKVNNIGTKIHDGAQGKHIIGHGNYLSGRSTLNQDINPQELLNGIHSGTYPVISKGARGNSVVDFGRPIGIDGKSGLSTNFGTIHSGKHGVHIVPANPKTIKQVK